MNADFGVALGILAAVLAAVEHQSPRGACCAVSAVRDLVEQTDRQRPAGAGAQVEVQHLGLHLARRGAERGKQRGAFTSDNIGELERAERDLRQILIEPGRQRGIEIDDVALGIDREEPGRGMVQIVDGVLQLLKDVFLPLALARNVGDRPDRELSVTPRLAERTHAHPQPARRLAGGASNADFLLQAPALAGGLE